METIPFNVKCQLIPLLQLQKSYSTFYSIFQSSYQITPFWVFPVHTCQWSEGTAHNHNSCSNCSPAFWTHLKAIVANPNIRGINFPFMLCHSTEIQVCAQSCVALIQKTVDGDVCTYCNPCTGCKWNGYNLFSRTVRHATLRKSSCCRRNVTSAGP
jgi:hypothetical protein